MNKSPVKPSTKSKPNSKLQTSNVKKGKIYKGNIYEEKARQEKAPGNIENQLNEVSMFPKIENINQRYHY